jgi:putative ABC transport system permease protein
LDKTQTPFDIITLDQALSDSIAPRRLNLLVLVTFAAAALLLALVGIYGVMAYSVSQRTHEIGIRAALGARRRDVVGMIVWQGLRVAVAGTAVGVAAALLLTRAMSSLLFQVEPTDPPTFVITGTALALAAVFAAAVPALKAGGVDPLVALRYE